MRSLSSRERLERCYRHQEIDRPGLYLRGVSATAPGFASYQPVRDLIVSKGDLKFVWGHNLAMAPQQSVTVDPYSEDFDRVTTMVHTPAGDLRHVYLSGLKGQPGMCVEHLLKTSDDAARYLSLPAASVAVDLANYAALEAASGDRGIVEVDLGLNPGGHVADLFGSVRFAEMTIEDREIVHALAAQRREHMLRGVKWLIDHCPEQYFALLGQEYIAPPLHGRADFFEFNVQYDKPIADLVHNAGRYLHVHCHGSVRTVLDGFIEIGADVLHPLEAPPMGDVTAKQAKDVLRGKICIEGNIQIGDLYTRGVDDTREAVKALVKDTFDDRRGLIVCPSASPYVPDMPELYHTNVAAIVDVVTTWH